MIEYLSENLWQLWLAVGLVCMILELSSGDLYVLCFGVGGIITAALSPLIPSFYVQILLFVVLSLLCTYQLRPIALRWLHRNEPNRVSNADAIIGRTGTVSEPIAEGGYGRVALDGDDWKARSADGSAIEKGVRVVITGRESIIITVEKA